MNINFTGKNKRSTCPGYTIIEAVIAMCILVIFFVVLTSMSTLLYRFVLYTFNLQNAKDIAGSMIANCRINSHIVPENQQGTTVIQGRSYKWKQIVTDMDGEGKIQGYFKCITVQVQWDTAQGTGRLERKTYVVLPGVADPLIDTLYRSDMGGNDNQDDNNQDRQP